MATAQVTRVEPQVAINEKLVNATRLVVQVALSVNVPDVPPPGPVTAVAKTQIVWIKS